MKKTNYLALDGYALRVFLSVLETGSVTAAAEHLGVTQSAVSHTIEKLREITGSQLFVRAGRGIAATSQAKAMAEPVRKLLDDMYSLTQDTVFEPASSQREFIIATNDYQRDLLLPPVLKMLCAKAPGAQMRIMPAGIPTAEQLRDGYCDLIICTEPPKGNDISNVHLMTDQLVCYYDSAHTKAPATMEEYLRARHIGLRFDDSERADFERRFRARGIHRSVAVVVDSVASIPGFMRGTDLLAIAPSMLAQSLMSELAWAPAPFPLPALDVHMSWHNGNTQDGAHSWLRGLILQSTNLLRTRLAGSG